MEIKTLFTDDRAVSPVVGVALLIAIAVILAVVIGAVVLNLGPGGAGTPSVDAASNYTASAANNLTVTHRGGDPLPAKRIVLRDESGNEVRLSNAVDPNGALNDSELTAGETVYVTDNELSGIASNQTVTVVYQSENGDKTTVLDEFDP